MSSAISTIHPNPPLSALRFFSLLRFGKTKLLFCSHLNRNAEKEGLWQGGALHMLRFVKRTLTIIGNWWLALPIVFFSVFACVLSLFRILSVIYLEARFQQTITNYETNKRKQTTHPPR